MARWSTVTLLVAAMVGGFAVFGLVAWKLWRELAALRREVREVAQAEEIIRRAHRREQRRRHHLRGLGLVPLPLFWVAREARKHPLPVALAGSAAAVATASLLAITGEEEDDGAVGPGSGAPSIDVPDSRLEPGPTTTTMAMVVEMHPVPEAMTTTTSGPSPTGPPSSGSPIGTQRDDPPSSALPIGLPSTRVDLTTTTTVRLDEDAGDDQGEDCLVELEADPAGLDLCVSPPASLADSRSSLAGSLLATIPGRRSAEPTGSRRTRGARPCASG